MSVFPVFLKLDGRRVLVAGGGPVAASKIDALVAAGADVTVVAPEVCESIERSGVHVAHRAFAPGDLDGAWFVVAAATPDVNREIAAEAHARQVFVNAVDDPPNATAYLGGIVRRAGLTVAISTDGAAPALAGLVREALEAMLPSSTDMSRWLRRSRAMRRVWKRNRVPMPERRPHLLTVLNRLYRRREQGVEVPS